MSAFLYGNRSFPHGGRRTRGLTFCLLVALLLPGSAGAQVYRVKEVKRVLAFYEWSVSGPGIASVDKEIRSALQSLPYQVEFYTENLETNLFPSESFQQELREWYVHKYRDHKPDVIIAEGPPSIRFVLESRQRFFPDTPVVFCCSPEAQTEDLHLDSRFTGTLMLAVPEKTLEVALRLRPRTKKVVVIGGVSPFDRHVEEIVRESLQKFQGNLDITYLTDLAMPALLERLAHLPDDTVVFYTSLSRDAAGTPFIDATDVLPTVSKVANAPVFVMADSYVGRGAIGGYACSYAEQGRIVGQMTAEILQGKTPAEIPIAKDTNAYMFDWQAMKRWGLKESALPPGSIVLNRQPTLWESYKWYIIGTIFLILVQALWIFGLAWQRLRRRKAEAELAITYERLRMAVEAGKSVGWDWDVKRGDSRWFGDLQTMFGISSDNYSGHVEDFRRRIHPEDLDFVWNRVADAKQSRRPYAAEFRVVRVDGTVRWIKASGKFYATNDDAERMLGMAVDITERKMAEEALARLSGRLIEAQEEERRRIAREIHDDYQQRLAMLAIDLEDLAQNIGSASGEASGRVHELWNRVSELGADLHDLSHRLHSSTLENLGLVAGVRAFCEEFADQQGVQVDFTHENVPRAIPGDVALCLFRIAQEGLRNIKRHGGTDRAQVRLEGLGEGLHLSVSDRGRGFDLNEISRSGGIGIRSMEERLRVLGGSFEIHSRPMEGTRIDARLPFKTASQRAS